jgi:phosphopantetheinyl transferase
LFKDEFGKPLLVNDTHHCSLSHSRAHVAAIIHTKAAVGIDIQHLHPRILSIANKFVNETEQITINANDAILQTHVIWGAKESLFKLHGKGNVDFKKNLTVMPFEISSQGRTTAYIDLPDFQALCQIHYSHTPDYVLVAGLLE